MVAVQTYLASTKRVKAGGSDREFQNNLDDTSRPHVKATQMMRSLRATVRVPYQAGLWVPERMDTLLSVGRMQQFIHFT